MICLARVSGTEVMMTFCFQIISRKCAHASSWVSKPGDEPTCGELGGTRGLYREDRGEISNIYTQL